MSPEEFNRLKEEEKAHLRGLRDLKQQYRSAQQKASILGALRGMDTSGLTAETDAQTDALMRGAITSEARLDLALEGEAERARAEADRETMRQDAAAELVRQMKADAGSTADEAPARAGTPTGAARTIGRTPPPADAAPDAPTAARDPKTLGRPKT